MSSDSMNEKESGDGSKTVNACSMHPDSALFKTVGLIFICSIGFGSYFCYDIPGALEEEFEHAMDMTSTEFSLMYALYSLPNCILPLIGGFLIDRIFGIRLGATIFAAVIAGGQVLTTLGVFLDSKLVVYAGRLIFGLGGENLAVVCSTYASAWFKGHLLNMAVGLQLSVVRLGSGVSIVILGPVYEALMPENCVIDQNTTLTELQSESENFSFESTIAPTSSSTASDDYNCEKEENIALGYVLAIASTTVFLSLLGAIIAGIMDKVRSKYVESDLEEQPKVSFRDINTFPISFWLTSIVCVSYYVSIFPFISFAQPFFKRKDGFNFSDLDASIIQSLPFYMSVVLAPTLGFAIDRMGRNIAWVLFSCICTLIAHCLLALQSSQILGWVAMVILGIGYSTLASALWPIVALVVPLHRQGTAFGAMTSIQNLGLTIIGVCAGKIKDQDETYVWLEIFYIAWLAIAIITTVLLWFLDYRQYNYLFMTEKQKKVFETNPEYYKMMRITYGDMPRLDQ